MAYTLTYTANFSNEKNQEVLISIFRKDGLAPTEVVNFDVVKFDLTDNGEAETVYNWIYTRQLDLALWIPDQSPVSWETFIASEYDDWMITATIDGNKYFDGFIIPEEGEGPFQDQPYEIIVRATVGLALLKEVELVDVNGEKFTGDNTLIDYIAGALKQTGLELPIRIYCTILFGNHQNKGGGLEYDMFSQTYLDCRTFLKDAVTFVSCHDALKTILDGFCSLEYWNGMWQIVFLGDKQSVPGDWFFVDRDANGQNPTGAKVTENHAQVGKGVDVYAINETQVASSVFAVRSTKSTYRYEVFDNLVPNDGIGTLGPLIPGLSGDVLDVNDEDNDGNTSEVIGTYQGYELEGWVHKKKFFAEVDPVTKAYIKSEKDLYGREISRYYVVERDATSPVDVSSLNYIRNSVYNFYVKSGDRIDISITAKLNSDISTIFGACALLLFTGGDVTDPTRYYWLDPFGTFRNINPAVGAINPGWAQFSGSDLDLSKWQTQSLTNINIPADGTLIVKLQDSFSGSATEAHFKDLKLTYYIFVGGSYFSAKGDYWIRLQDKKLLNVYDEQVYISDSPRRITKGALIFKNETVDYNTDPEWYRFYQIGNINPSGVYTHFKKLLNLAQYNLAYRRFYKIEGDFDGLNYSPENDGITRYPHGFHKRYRFVDMAEPREFVLTSPLKYDVVRGWINAKFVEVYKDSADGTQVGDSESFNYLFQ